MKTLREYFRELLIREGKRPVNLVAEWKPSEIVAIRRRLKAACGRGALGRKLLSVEEDLTSPALGNRLARLLAPQLDRALEDLAIQRCAGQGYPDRRLVWADRNKAFALELKATTRFEPKDNNRVILTSSPEKLLKWFAPPVHHLMATFLYRRNGAQVKVRTLRLTFLQPWTKVYVRLEASVTQRLLAAEDDLAVCDVELN